MILLMIILGAYEVISMEATKDGYTTTPSNLAIVAGKPLRLECGFVKASQILWYYEAPSTKTNRVLIYNGEAINNKTVSGDFSVDSSSAERRDLVANEAKLEHAGVYDCVVLISKTSFVIDQEHSAKAQVIVLASDPVCWSNLSDPGDRATEFDSVLIQCDLKYAGGWFPTWRWFKQPNNGSNLLKPAPNESLSMGRVSSFVLLQVNSKDNGAVFICKTYFIWSGNQVTTNASNIPDYVYHWNITVNVEYGPRNTSVQPLLDSYDVNSNLSCEADGNPVPVYTWQDMETSAITKEPTLVISKGIAENDAQYAYKCTAQNTIQGHTRENSIVVTVRIKGTYAVRNVTITIGILCILLMALVFYFSRTYIKDGCGHVQSVFRRREDNGEPDVVPGVQDIEEDYANPGRDPLPFDGYMDLAELAAGNAEVHDGRNLAVQNDPEIRENDADDMDRPVQIVLPVYCEVKKVNKLHDRVENPTHLQACPHGACILQMKPIWAPSNGHEPVFGKQKPVCKSGEEMVAERFNSRYYGADGTEYMEMNAFKQKPKPESVMQSSVFEAVEYASIDHRLTPPPPPALPQVD